MIRYLKLLILILLLAVFSGCEQNSTFEVSDNIIVEDTLTLKTTTIAETIGDTESVMNVEDDNQNLNADTLLKKISTEIEVENREMTEFVDIKNYQYIENDVIWFYDINYDGVSEMIKISDNGLYQYSVYSLLEGAADYIGDFYVNDDIYGTVCKLYKCYDSENGESFCVTEEIFNRLGCTESYVKKISLFPEGVLYDTIVSKRTYYNDDNSMFIINDRGNIICGENNDETAMSYFSDEVQITDVFIVDDVTSVSQESTYLDRNDISIYENDELHICDGKKIGNLSSIEKTIRINDSNDISRIKALKEYSDLVELSVIDDFNIINDYSFLVELSQLKMLTVKSGNSLNLQTVLPQMKDLKYLEYNTQEELESLDFLTDCTELEFLYLGSGVKSDNDEAYELLNNMPHIKVIAFSGMYNYVTKEQIYSLRKNIPNCLIVFIK